MLECIVLQGKGGRGEEERKERGREGGREGGRGVYIIARREKEGEV